MGNQQIQVQARTASSANRCRAMTYCNITYCGNVYGCSCTWQRNKCTFQLKSEAHSVILILWTPTGRRSQASAVKKSDPSSIFLPISKDGNPRYGQVEHLKASPRPHCMQDTESAWYKALSTNRCTVGKQTDILTLPQADWGCSIMSWVRSIFCTAASASALPHVQFLHAFLPAPTSQSSAAAQRHLSKLAQICATTVDSTPDTATTCKQSWQHPTTWWTVCTTVSSSLTYHSRFLPILLCEQFFFIEELVIIVIVYCQGPACLLSLLLWLQGDGCLGSNSILWLVCCNLHLKEIKSDVCYLSALQDE